MVPLHDLNVVAVAQYGGGLLHQLQQHIDAKGHVGRAENGYLLSSGADLGYLLRGVAGGSQHQGGAGGLGKVQQTIQGGGRGEVDNGVCLAGKLSGGGINEEFSVVGAQHVKARDHLDLRIGGAQGLYDPAHMSVAAGNDYLQHGGLLTSAIRPAPWRPSAQPCSSRPSRTGADVPGRPPCPSCSGLP